MRTTAIVNQKGGVGKTATAVNTAGALAEAGHRALAVDLDPQGHLSAATGTPPADDDTSLAAALTGAHRGPPDTTTHTRHAAGGQLDVMPTAWAMFTTTRELDRARAREYRLARALRPLDGDYDHCLIDCPPALDVLTDNALTAADGLLIPVQAEDSTLRALRLLMAQVNAVEADLRDTPLEMGGLVVSLLRRPPSLLARSVLEQLDGLDGMRVLATVPLGVTVTEAWRSGQTVGAYAPQSEHATAYRAIAAAIAKGDQ